MKTLAIDWGTKKIGLAISNQAGTISFPHQVLHNDKRLLKKLKEIVQDEEVKRLVVGVPKYNPKTEVYYQIEEFISDLKSKFEIPVEIQDELLTSEAAKKAHSSTHRKVGEIKPKSKDSHDLAAMLILEEYLQNN